MTLIVYDRNAGTVSISGHAGAGGYGTDLVCAALSMLMYTLIEALPGARHALSDGSCRVEVGQHSAEMEAVCSGFRLLAKEYPDNVTYKEVNSDDPGAA